MIQDTLKARDFQAMMRKQGHDIRPLEYALTAPKKNPPEQEKAKKARKRRNEREHLEQKVLVAWCRLQGGRLRDARKIFAIPNGGGRSKAEAGRLKAEGVLTGMPDLCLPVPRIGYNALYIEMKAPGEYARPEQREKIRELREDGYAAVVCQGAEPAIRAIESYLLGTFINPENP